MSSSSFETAVRIMILHLIAEYVKKVAILFKTATHMKTEGAERVYGDEPLSETSEFETCICSFILFSVSEFCLSFSLVRCSFCAITPSTSGSF